jgi:hypothetical protein
MRRSSIVAPLLLIVLGLLLLWENVGGGPSVLQVLSAQWPWILVGWGLLRLLELFLQWQQDRPVVAPGLTGGEWFLVFVMCVVGSGLYGANGRLPDFSNLPIGGPGARLLGESYEFLPESQRREAGPAPQLLVENMSGEVVVRTEPGTEIRVSGRETVRGESEDDARSAWQSRGITLDQEGDRIVLRSNLETLPPARQPRAFLEIVVPPATVLEARGRKVRFEVTGVQGSVRLDSDEGDAVLKDLGASADIRLDRSREIRASNVAGALEVRSNRGDNLDVENLQGALTASGAFSGNTRLRSVGGPVEITDRRLSFRAVAVPGEVTATRGDFLGKGVTGPLRVASEAKDIELEEFTGPAEIDIERRDARIRPNGPQLSALDIRAARGKVTLLLPAAASFQLHGTARRGEVVNRTGVELNEAVVNGRSEISGGPASAPKVTIEAARIELETAPAPRR